MPTPGQEISSLDFASIIGGPLSAMVHAQKQSALTTVDYINSVGFNAEEGSQDHKKPIYVDFKYPKEVAPYVAARIGQVTSVTVSNPGTGYTSAPTVTISGGGATTDAVAEAVLNSNGGIAEIRVLSPGEGYTSAPTVAIAGGDGADGAATAVVEVKRDAVPAIYQDMVVSVPILTMLPIPFIRIERGEIAFNCKINNMTYADTASSLKVGGSLQFKQKWLGGSVKLNVSASYQKTNRSGEKTDRTYTMAVKVVAVQDEMPAGMERLLGILEDAITAVPASSAPATA